MRRLCLLVACIIWAVSVAEAQVAFNAATYGGNTTGTSQTTSHTTAGTNRFLAVCVWADTASDLISGVTYNGVSMTLVDKQLHTGLRYHYLFGLMNPAIGANNVVTSASSSTFIQTLVASYTGVAQAGQPEAAIKTTATAQTSITTPLTTVTANAWTVNCVGSGAGSAAGTNFTERTSDTDFNTVRMGDFGPQASPASVSMTVTSASTNFSSQMIALAPAGSTNVTIAQADDAVAVVAGGGAGTTYTFSCTSPATSCTHRITSPMVPKAGDTLTTSVGAIINGSIVLTSPTVDGSAWRYDSVTARSSDHAHTGTSTDCDAGVSRCKYPEDLLIDNVVKRHVTSTGAVTTGTWFYDYAANKVYIGDDPTGKTVELTVAENAFKSTANNVTITNLTIEKVAVLAQFGAIEADGSSGWTVGHVEIRYAHGRGISLGDAARLHHSYIHHNFQMGIGGGGDNTVVEENEIAYNRSAVVGIDIGWEAGGTKFAFTNNLIVRNNRVHHNDGLGLWTDISNRGCEIYGNRVDDNTWSGIMHEISGACIIRNNVIRRNGLTHPNVAIGGKKCFVPDSGIFVAAAANVEVYANYLEGNADGICGLQQDRSSDETFFGEATGTYRLRGLNIHDNFIASAVASGTQGVGISADYLTTEVVDLSGTYAGANDPVEVRQPAGTGYNNRWECNHYYLSDGNSAATWWLFLDYTNFANWQALGHDSGGGCTSGAGSYAAFSTYVPFSEFAVSRLRFVK